MKLLLKIAAGLALAVAAYFWATGLMDALFGYRSPLRQAAPPPGQPAADPLTRRLVFVLVDGLRLDTALDAKLMPTLAGLRAQGAWAASHSRPPSYSQTGYTVMLTGAWPALSDGPAINLDSEQIYTFSQDDLFSVAQRAGLKTAISGYYWFEKLVPQSAVTTGFYTPLDDLVADQQVVQAVLPWLQSGEFQFVLIHLDQVDYAGHYEGGPRDERWNAAARRVDDHLAEIVAALDLSQDTLFLTSDHGHIDRGGHGGQDAIVLLEPFLLVGAGVRPGQYPDANMVDVAPTLATLLGLSIPASNQGQPRLDMLSADAEASTRIQSALAAQQRELLTAYAAATGLTIPLDTGQPQAALEQAVNQRLFNESLPRLGLALLLLAAAGAWLWFSLPRAQLPWLAVGIVVYWLVFHAKYVLLDGRTYSLSSVYSSDDIIFSTALTAALALLTAWVAAGLGLKLHRDRRAAAEISANLCLSILFSLLLAIGWNYFRNGLWPTWTLPADFNSLFLGFLSLLQVLLVGALLPLLTGLGALLARLAPAR